MDWGELGVGITDETLSWGVVVVLWVTEVCYISRHHNQQVVVESLNLWRSSQTVQSGYKREGAWRLWIDMSKVEVKGSESVLGVPRDMAQFPGLAHTIGRLCFVPLGMQQQQPP